ncbi:MAG: RNA pseudouridine synthase [Alphaproteobacteria bacterium]|nr:RNA pseudouridine synthase [Alphaproteobacteria bacterium]
MLYQHHKVKKLNQNYIVTFTRKPPAKFIYDPPQGPLEVLYEDEDILVLDKPCGLLSVPGRRPEHADSLQNRAQEQYPQARIVHRLDEPTSGVIIMAMNAQSHRNIGLQFERRKTQKIYIAKIWGHIDEDQGEVDLPLLCDWPNRPLQMVDYEQGRAAQTGWEVLKRECINTQGQEYPVTRIALYPKTGRSHQLRVHMMEQDHPILGDEFYAHDKAYASSSRLLLHAHKLMIYHPKNGEKTWFKSPCPF